MGRLRSIRPVLLAAVLLMPAGSQAAETCPWLNAATAGGLLGGTVTATVTRDTANRDDAVCTFVRAGAELRIEVQTMNTPARAAQCVPGPAPLRAIGNEAVVCTEAGRAQVVGRVRNRNFAIMISAPDGAMPPDALREKARAAAEHVAGNLF